MKLAGEKGFSVYEQPAASATDISATGAQLHVEVPVKNPAIFSMSAAFAVGIVASLLSTLAAGGTVICPPGFDARRPAFVGVDGAVAEGQ